MGENINSLNYWLATDHREQIIMHNLANWFLTESSRPEGW